LAWLACATLLAGCFGPSDVPPGTTLPGHQTAGNAPAGANNGAPSAAPQGGSADGPADSTPQPASAQQAAAGSTAAASQPPARTFAPEGPNGALRITFDDLDLYKLLAMDPVTEDCVEKMPPWLRDLSGKKVRIRGYMKPGLLTEGIPQFVFVRDTGLCCFGPKGKVHDMINVSLRKGLTTRYIELTPFDVEGTFQIELFTLDDMIAGLYHMQDAVILPIRPAVAAPLPAPPAGTRWKPASAWWLATVLLTAATVLLAPYRHRAAVLARKTR